MIIYGMILNQCTGWFVW